MNDRLLNMTELMQKLGIASRKTIYNWRKQGMPTFQVSKGNPRFDFNEVKNWMKNKTFVERNDRNE
ncbi:hypothetical protein KCTCHS21_01480 [Cohnella abietis]|uniref:Helix-turn-helix domain-containing protein n=1 Tax=Cohnella abietis TaxID=2507935 RepID=A0A3T1CY97_9BACL|nr:hypothetical protein KCTCHS21_01480 [Cohnella abietis]